MNKYQYSKEELKHFHEKLQSAYDNLKKIYEDKENKHWKFLFNKKGLKYYSSKYEEDSGQYVCKFSMEMNTSTEFLVKYITSWENLKDYESFVTKLDCLDDLTNKLTINVNKNIQNSKLDKAYLLHSEYISYWPIFAARDSLYLFTFKKISKDTTLAAMISVTSKICPLNESKIRIDLRESGYVLKQLDKDNLLIEGIINVNMKGWINDYLMSWLQSVDTSAGLNLRDSVEKRYKESLKK